MKKLRFRELIFVASMLFGMFFGAGNLIFPASMGQLAGSNMWQAAAGFLITGVGLPLLGVAALGISREESLLELSSRVGKRYGLFFTCALYLAIGPFLAIPRCATVSFTVGVERILPAEMQTAALAVFSAVFFAAVLFFSLRPGEILTWVGKVLNPLFLCLLGVLVVRAVLSPMGSIGEIPVRSRMYQGQTPQSFQIRLLKELYASLDEEEKAILTDACKMAVVRDHKVSLVQGEPSNLKITTVSDYKIAQAMVGGKVID